MRLRSITIMIAGLLVASAAASDAASNALKREASQFAAELPLSNGFAKSRHAGILIGSEQEEGQELGEIPDTAPIAEIERLSLSAYRMEPLDRSAMRNLALLAENRGDEDEALAAMSAVRTMTRRDLAANLWLAQQSGKMRDAEAALGYLDEALRTSLRGRELLIPVVLQNLTDPSLIPSLVALLESSPPWSDLFWGSATEFVPALPNTAELRIQLARKGVTVKEDYDRRLIEVLARTRQHEPGLTLARLLQGKAADRVMVNGDFGERGLFQPYDWAPVASGSRSGEILEAENRLRIYSVDGGGGPVATQVVRMPAGRYRLQASYADQAALGDGGVTFRLTCLAEAGGASSPPVLIPAPKVETTIVVPTDNCVYRRLDIALAASSDRSERIYALDRFEIIRTGAN